MIGRELLRSEFERRGHSMRTARDRGTRAATVFVAVLALVAVGTAHGQEDRVSVERPGSILIFPKVINANGQDTVVQITNTSTMASPVHCFYVDGQPVGGEPRCQVLDFELMLTRQQPTHWQVSLGRNIDPTDSQGGIDPGLVPPVPQGFTGGLICVALDSAQGVPITTNNLKGEATIGNVSGTNGNAVAKYNAVAVAGVGANTDTALDLNYDFANPGSGEFARCPDSLGFTFEAEGGPDPAINALGVAPSKVFNAVTLMPCNMDFETGFPSSVTFGTINVIDEFEGLISSGPLTISCWENFTLDNLSPASAGQLPSLVARVQLLPDANGFGAVGVQTTVRQDGNANVASDSSSLQQNFESNPAAQVQDSTIRIPN